jgi:hypothetical protein
MASIILIGNKATKNELQIQVDLALSTDNLILIDSSIRLSEEQMQSISDEASMLDEYDLAYISCNGNMSKEEIAGLDAETLLNSLINRSSLPIAAIACKKAVFESILADELDNLSEISLRLFAKAIVAGARTISAGQLEASSQAVELENSSFARSLGMLINTFAIEELFPQYAWKEHSEESAAVSYHTLTAYFMRFEDYKSANECLILSEQFEESPRSLALRAMIAFNKGETLGAVANLVSSLQQYEERKKSTTHYVKFSPQDIELINSSLVSGLDALNKRDNEKAIDHFAKAVFNFDAFYSQHGLEEQIQ